jgi:hypothetical protein
VVVEVLLRETRVCVRAREMGSERVVGRQMVVGRQWQQWRRLATGRCRLCPVVGQACAVPCVHLVPPCECLGCGSWFTRLGGGGTRRVDGALEESTMAR